MFISVHERDIFFHYKHTSKQVGTKIGVQEEENEGNIRKDGLA